VVRTNAQAQYHDFELWLQANQDKMKTIIDGIKPMLDFIDPELLEPDVYTFGDRPLHRMPSWTCVRTC
jgi:hypothetical protein